MTEDEIEARLAEVAAECPGAEVSVTIKPAGEAGYCYIRKGRYGSPGEFSTFGRGLNVAACIVAALDEYRAHAAQIDRNTKERMALAIIRVTHEHGSCCRSQLRQDFEAADIDRLADAAAALATDMGAGGPFSVIDDAANSNSAAA